MIIGNELLEALCEQISSELYNASVYMQISSFLGSRGLGNLSKHFVKQYKEEQEHAELILNFISDMGSVAKIMEVPAVENSLVNFSDVASLYLEREIETTKSLDEIKRLAIEKVEPVAEEFIRNMIGLQKDEYKEATEWKDKADIIGDDWKTVMLWDASLK